MHWAIAQRCPFREGENWEFPGNTERQLRSLRIVNTAVQEGRCLDEICVAADSSGLAEPLGFRATDVWSAYGGQPFAEETCRHCPANAFHARDGKRLAGCFGWFEFGALGREFHWTVDRLVASLGKHTPFPATFLATKPAWFGLWLSSPLIGETLHWHARLARELSLANPSLADKLQDWQEALATAIAGNLPLFVEVMPPGTITGRDWTVDAHCSRCHAAQPMGTRHCAVCQRQGGPQQPRRRQARGNRPYGDLANCLGKENVTEFLQRYVKSREYNNTT